MTFTEAQNYIKIIYGEDFIEFNDDCICGIDIKIENKDICACYISYNKILINDNHKRLYWPIKPHKINVGSGLEYLKKFTGDKI